eukprot:Hpha_TRINITY_DN15237_c0_g1::TRINITY_DN15237_c0_g1_i1::g.64406::m.64406
MGADDGVRLRPAATHGGGGDGDAEAMELVGHTLPRGGKLVGAAALLFVLGSMALGPVLPLAAAWMFWSGWWACGAMLAAILTAPYVVEVPWTPWVSQIVLLGGGWFRHPVTAWYEKRLIEKIAENNGSMWCLHPHGTSVGMGFALNGALRYKACMPEKYLHEEVRPHITEGRVANMSGIMADVLFKVPLVRPLLHSLGCCRPATKSEILKLFDRRSDFGILPGGMDEVLLYRKGREVVYIRNRKGFMKYALQHGYLVVVGYTFGEADLYRSSNVLMGARSWAMRTLGFVLPIFWGPLWVCPLLPSDKVPINTVLGAPLQLPHIANPTDKEVAEYHQLYVDALVGLFDRNKARFGCADRVLEVL